MNWLKEKIKKYIGEIFLLGGAFLFSFNILDFDYNQCGHSGVPLLGQRCDGFVAYFFSDDVRFLVAVSILFVVLGLLIIKNNYD